VGTATRKRAPAPPAGSLATRRAAPLDPPQELHAAATAAVPGPRAPDGTDTARVVAFLASEAAAGIHGQTIYVDGGVSSMAFPGLERA